MWFISIVYGTNITLFNHEIIDGIITVLWVIILMNSLNMLDNMDGITATTVLFTLLYNIFRNANWKW